MHATRKSDRALAARIADGQEDAAAELFRRHSGEMYGYARKMLGDATLAEDVLQEAMLGMLRGAASYDGSVSLRSWGFGILRHKLIDALRKRGREPVTRSAEPEDGFYGADGHWREGVTLAPWNENAEVVDVVRQCMELLPHAQREALHLRAIDELPAKEVATILDMSYPNLRQVLHRARQAVRRCADQKLGSAPGGAV